MATRTPASTRVQRQPSARGRWVPALAIAGLALAGCSSSHAHAAPTSASSRTTVATTKPTATTAATTTTAKAAATTTASSGTSTTSASQSSRCHTSELTASLKQAGAGAGGNNGTVLTLSNKSSRTCTLYGYVGLQLVDANRRFLPTTVQRGQSYFFHDQGPTSISLTPGQSAHAGIAYGNHVEGSEPYAKQCPSATYLEVTPPDEKDYLFIDAKGIKPCGGFVEVTALQLGNPS